ncbi:MAG TPA: DUF3606 domain-containing protein [Burkholderiales bacterium]|nr:DUF3606 domain-containing protein [Burkholderiales bacterium]
MNMNLVLATGLAYAFIGALIMFLSHRALYVKATRIVAGYPRVLAALRAQRHDARFGLIVLLCGNVLQVLAACGYTISMAHWRFPSYAALAVIAVYTVWRLLTARRAMRTAWATGRAAVPIRRVYETRRSMILLEAARKEAANRRAREAAKGSRDRSVVYVGQDLDCRWWSERFGVTPEALRAAVRQVGPMVKDIERHFARTARRSRYALAA